MADELVEKLLAGASLHCVMQPDDEIPTNSPLHDECFALPHVIVNGDKFTAITGRDLVTKPGQEWPIVFYYTNYRELFGTIDPVRVEPGFINGDKVLRMGVSPRKRYRKFKWLLRGKYTKIWDSQGGHDFEPVRSAVLRAAPMKAVFLDEEQIWNIHPILLPQVVRHENSFLMQTAYLPYPNLFRQPEEIERLIDSNKEWLAWFRDAKQCFTGMREMLVPPFHAFYHLHHDGTYKSYYDLARGDTMRTYQRLMIFAEEE